MVAQERWRETDALVTSTQFKSNKMSSHHARKPLAHVKRVDAPHRLTTRLNSQEVFYLPRQPASMLCFQKGALVENCMRRNEMHTSRPARRNLC